MMKLISILLFAASVAFFAGCASLNDDTSKVFENKCRACHAMPPVGKVHTTHGDSLHYACDVCHPGVVDSTETVPVGHGSEPIKVQIAKKYDSTGAFFYNAAKKSCNAVTCHGYDPGRNPGVVYFDSSNTGCGFCHPLNKLVNESYR